MSNSARFWRLGFMKIGMTCLGVALLLGLLALTGCSHGGYIQVGYIPVNGVADTHTFTQQQEKGK